MKYRCTVEIDAPLEAVVALWENEKHFAEWQDGFKSITLLEGIANTKGAKSKLVFEDQRRIELIETILSNELPKEKVGLYEHKHMTNTQTTKFEALDSNTTLYISEVHYSKFNGVMIKLFARFFPSKFKQQSQKWMNQFKAFAEKELTA